MNHSENMKLGIKYILIIYDEYTGSNYVLHLMKSSIDPERPVKVIYSKASVCTCRNRALGRWRWKVSSVSEVHDETAWGTRVSWFFKFICHMDKWCMFTLFPQIKKNDYAKYMILDILSYCNIVSY